MDSTQFRKYGYEFVDWIADYMEKVEQYPVRSEVEPGEIKKQLPAEPPQQGEPMAKIFVDFQQIIMPGITHWQHPSWFAYFPANNSPASVLGEILTAGIGAQAMVWQTSPAATELEEVVMEWLRQMLGLPQGMEGVIQDSASTSTLCALLTAREVATNYQANEIGVRQPLVIYASQEGHSSIDKAVKIAGYGKSNLRHIPTDENYAMIPEKLEEAIINDLKNGLIPACVVASVGTTSSTAVDPVRQIGEVCKKHQVWLHVDAAFSGTAAVSEENRWMLDGAEYIDSFVFNPHKWMLTNFDCSAFFVRDVDKLKRTFEIHPEYLKTGADEQVKNFRDWGIQLGRRFRALKLWFVIRSYGVEGIQQMVREHMRLAQLFKGWVDANEHFELLAPVTVSLVVFRLNTGGTEEHLEQLNRTLLEEVNATGKVFLTHTSLKGRFCLRMAIGGRTTQEHHVREAWDMICAKAQEIM